MNREGFVPYGPARSGAEALARIMAADLTGSGVTANILLPGGATATGMVPGRLPARAARAAAGPAGHGAADPLALLAPGRRGTR
jgi:gluconate 5-dehydrogenase